MIRLSSPRPWLVGAVVLLGLAAGCHHFRKNCDSCEPKCEPNPCPPMCEEECGRSSRLFGWLKKKDCDQPNCCDHAKGAPCGQPHCAKCAPAACTTCGKSDCKRCGKADCTTCKQPSCKKCGKPGCTTCCAPCEPQLAPATPPKTAYIPPEQQPGTTVVPAPKLVPTTVPVSNERFKMPKPSEKATLDIPAGDITLPTRPMQTVLEHEAPKPVLAPQVAVTLSPAPAPAAVPVIKNVEPAPRRSFADITAKPQFQRASDYSYLIGELQYHAKNGEWRLRYASIEEEDRYGGSVTLINGAHVLENLKDGAIVKVEGMLVDPESREPSPKYRVLSAQPVGSK